MPEGDFFSLFEQAGIGFGGIGGGIGKTLNIFVFFIFIGVIIYLLYWWNERRKYNIIIRGHDLRGNVDFEFNDKAREFITFNRAELKLLKRKAANVIIPNLKQYRSMVTGQRVIHIFKYGAVNDYVVLDPQIVMDMNFAPLLDNDGKPILDEDGKPKGIEIPKYELHITESQNKEHSIRDLRDALARFSTKDAIQKYGPIITVIVIGLVILASSWIYGIYMVKAANINFDAMKMATETLNKFLEYQQVTGGIMPTP